MRHAGGAVFEGLYMDGKQHGLWVVRWEAAVGTVVQERPYVDGNLHGHWVERGPSEQIAGETADRPKIVQFGQQWTAWAAANLRLCPAWAGGDGVLGQR